jgi:hypothetical protein
MSARRIILAACAAAVLALGTAACSAPQQAAERIIEEQLGPGADIDINEDGGISGSVENEDGSYEIGTGKLPADWPADIPVPEGFTVTQAFTDASADSAIATFVATGDQSDAVKDFISALEAQGWEFAPESSFSVGWFGTKGDRYLNVGSQAGPETYITLVAG